MEDTATGALTRNVESATGDLAATTSKTGDTVLQLTNIHGDVALQLPLDTSKAPVALDNDEYGNPRSGQAATRYNWLGAKQRSTETLTGLTLMGVRLYNPTSGRFLSLDPVNGGGDNAYGYPGDPVNQYDLDGKAWYHKVGRWAWRNKWNIALTAATFVPGLGAVAWGVRAYRVVRAFNAGRSSIRATRASSWLAGKMHVGWRGVTRTRTRNGKARWYHKGNNHWRSAAWKRNQGGYVSNLERYQRGHHLHRNLHIQHRKPRRWAPWW